MTLRAVDHLLDSGITEGWPFRFVAMFIVSGSCVKETEGADHAANAFASRSFTSLKEHGSFLNLFEGHAPPNHFNMTEYYTAKSSESEVRAARQAGTIRSGALRQT
jgi:hypothetical protein